MLYCLTVLVYTKTIHLSVGGSGGYLHSTHQGCVDGCLGSGLWLSCNGDLLAAEESVASSFATFMAPTFQ